MFIIPTISDCQNIPQYAVSPLPLKSPKPNLRHLRVALWKHIDQHRLLQRLKLLEGGLTRILTINAMLIHINQQAQQTIPATS